MGGQAGCRRDTARLACMHEGAPHAISTSACATLHRVPAPPAPPPKHLHVRSSYGPDRMERFRIFRSTSWAAALKMRHSDHGRWSEVPAPSGAGSTLQHRTRTPPPALPTARIGHPEGGDPETWPRRARVQWDSSHITVLLPLARHKTAPAPQPQTAQGAGSSRRADVRTLTADGTGRVCRPCRMTRSNMSIELVVARS